MGESETSATERAYYLILNGILDGVYATGSMLGEASLAVAVGVSRTPVRTALTRLQDEGWIVIYPKRGALVKGLSERAVTELADARLILESAAVERATAGARQVLASRLRDSLAAQKEAFRVGDVRRFIELTIGFHRSFVESGESSVLLELNDRLADRQRYVLFSYGDTLLARCADIIAEHETLIDHMNSGDSAQFALILREHVASTLGRELL